MLFLHLLDIVLFIIGIAEKRRNPLGKVNPSLGEIINEWNQKTISPSQA
jgi:hypothetical protein